MEDTRVLGKLDWQQGGMGQLELRDESLRWDRQAVVFRLGHVVHRKRQGSHRKCSTRLEYEGVATSHSDMFTEERHKVDDNGGSWNFVGHEQNGGTRHVWESSLEGASEFQREQGLRDRVLERRETENIRMSQDAEGSRQRHKCGKFVLGMSSRETSAFVASERGSAETGCDVMVSVDQNALEIGVVSLLNKKSRDSEWNRIVCRGDRVRSCAQRKVAHQRRVACLGLI